MSAKDVAGLIGALRGGRLSLDETAEQFRRRDWPGTHRRRTASYGDMAAQQDVGADVPGSFDEVTAAYDRGELTSDEYRVLSEAAAYAINAQARRDS